MTSANKVFISYSRTDSERVMPLIEGIRRMRYEIWLDQELSGGQAWWNTILGHIRDCDVILLAVSQKAMESEACRQEFEYARALGKPILPVIVEQVPHQLLWSELAVIQLVDYTGPPGKAAFDLMSALSQLPAAGDLPDPLPAQPSVPMSYLTEMAHIVQARTLGLDEQLAVLGKLKARLRRPGEHEGVIQLIHKLRDRGDLFHATAVEINELLADRSLAPAEPVPPLQHTPVPGPPAIQAPPPVRPPPEPVPTPTPRVFTGPPPSVPPPQIARPAPPVRYPVPPATWVATSPPRSAGVPTWLILVLLISAGLAALGAAIFVAQIFSGSGALGGSRQQLVAAVEFAIAASAAVAALIGLMGGDRWGPVVGWVAVAALVLTVVGIPFAAAVAWGLLRTPRNQVAAAGSRPGGGLRLGSAALGSVLLIAITGSAGAYGWTHRQLTAGPVAKPTPTPTTCVIAQPDSPITAASAGGLCGFRLGSPVVQFDCRSANTLPSVLTSASIDYSKDSSGVAINPTSGDPCQLIAPSYRIDSRLVSVDSLPAGDIVMVADLAPVQPVQLLDVGFLYECDTKGCIQADVYTVDGSVNVAADTTNLMFQHVDLRTGSNRLMMEVHQQDIAVWLNGQALPTQKAGRAHGGGKYVLFMESYDKTGSVHMDILQFAVFHLA